MDIKLVLVLLSCGFIRSDQSLSAPYPHEPCDYDSSVDLTNATWNSATQRYDLDSISYGREHYREFNFTVLSNGTEVATAKPYLRGCICQLRPCVRSCCPARMYRDDSTGLCTATEHHLDFELDVIQENGLRKAVNFRDAFVYVHGKIKCAANELLAGLDPDDDTIDEKWELYWNGSSTRERTFCIDVTAYGEDLVDLGSLMFECIEIDENEPQMIKEFLLPIGMLFSIPFLVITFMVYALIPKLRTLHGKCLMSYVCILTVVYVCLAWIYLWGDKVEQTTCTALGFTVFISFMASILWLNVMCIDIWLTFRGITNKNKNEEDDKFVVYSCYVWGVSLAILIVVIVFNYSTILPKSMRPQFGVDSCFMKKSFDIMLFYLYIPFMFLICVNVIIFLMTAAKIRRMQNETNRKMSIGGSRKHSKSEADINRFFLYIRLFILMGITWIMEGISFLVDSDQNSWVCITTDFCNTMQGFLIFCFLLLTKKNRRLIVQRFKVMFNRSTKGDQSNSCKGTDTSMSASTDTMAVGNSP